MRKGIMVGVGLGFMLAVVGVSSSADGTICTLQADPPTPSCDQRVEFNVHAGVFPKRLPRKEAVPVALSLNGKIGIENGQPPALREAIIAVDGGVTIDPGLSTCWLRRLKSLSTNELLRECSGAIVGRGVAHVGLESLPGKVRTPLTLFNGGASGGLTRLFVHGEIEGPTPTSVVAVAKIARIGGGLQATLKVPPILEGDGSLLDFKITVERRFSVEGQPRSYVSARCPKRGIRATAESVLLRNETSTPGVSSQTFLSGALTISCGQ